MTDYSASQGHTSVNALAPNAGLNAAGNLAAPRKTVSADSFRRLTALLKKPDAAAQNPAEHIAIPSIEIVPAPVAAAPVVEAPVVVAPIEIEPAIAAPVVAPVLAEPETWQIMPESTPVVIAPEAAPAPELPIIAEASQVASEPWQIMPESTPVVIAPEAAPAPELPMIAEAAPVSSEPWQIVPEIASAPEFPTFAEAIPVVQPFAEEMIAPQSILPDLPAPEFATEILSVAPELSELTIEPLAQPEPMSLPEASPFAPQIEVIIHGIAPEAHAAFMADETPAHAPEPEIEMIAAPVSQPMAEMPVEPALEVAPEPISELMAEPTPAPVPETRKKIIIAHKPRDAFAVTPNLAPKKTSAPVIQQTPEQEQEAAELARSLLDMMASSNAAGLPQERALAADTLLRMLPRLPLKSLIMLSERVRLMEAPPHLLMAKLIAEPNIAVAGPLLEDCMHITDEDLLMVIGEGDFAKIRMIARRRRLTRAITSGLVTTGDDSVFLTLVRNLGAEIPQESFWALAEAAREFPDLLAPLCTRPDLPVPLAFELFWLAPTPLRRYLLSRFLTDSETLTKILKITRATDGEEQIENHFVSAEKILVALNLAGEGDMDGAAAALADYANINPITVGRILSDRMGEPLAALLKAAGLPRGQVSDIFEKLKTSDSGLIDPAREVEELQSTFDSLSFNKARILLTYWDWATLKTGPYAPLN